MVYIGYHGNYLRNLRSGVHHHLGHSLSAFLIFVMFVNVTRGDNVSANLDKASFIGEQNRFGLAKLHCPVKENKTTAEEKLTTS
jgi:hypothetical protein